ncbi:MAG: preprotein translocase subunit YajC [Acidobacteria bacterium]|nr:preprotein translocase subunit YajC [Acidobacteriota bacterium]
MNILLFFFQDSGAGSIFGLVLPLLLMGGIFYFLVILPQKRQKQQLAEMVASLQINDEIVTNGGIIGRVKEIRATSFIIMSAEKTLLEIGKAAVVGKKAES